MTYNVIFFFFSSRRRHTRCLSDWSSDVCSSDLSRREDRFRRQANGGRRRTNPTMSPIRYPIDREIGRGEMGVVYLAHDPRLDRPLAVKILTLPQSLTPAQSDEYRRRFLQEAKAAAALTHPGIVTVYDAGDEDGQLFIAMEYVQGETLRECLQRLGKIEPAIAVSIASCVADALHAAHEKGIVHRDIKPA